MTSSLQLQSLPIELTGQRHRPAELQTSGRLCKTTLKTKFGELHFARELHSSFGLLHCLLILTNQLVRHGQTAVSDRPVGTNATGTRQSQCFEVGSQRLNKPA